jgi:hypothetical protein
MGWNVVDLIVLPSGRQGRLPRTVTEEQAVAVIKAAKGQISGYVEVVKVRNGRYRAGRGAVHGVWVS